MKNELKNLIRKLSEMYDISSKDTYISVYLNKNTDKTFLEKRMNVCKSLLDKDEEKNFIETIEEINEFLKKNISNNIAIFASHTHNFFTSIPLHIEVNNSLIVDSSPYIRPLARILDELKPFTLILLNSNHAKIFSIYLGEIEEKKNLSSDIMNKHKKGGMSQARFQRIRKGAIHDFFKEVTEILDKSASGQIILAGPGPTKIQFRDMLPKHLQQRIIDIIDVDVDDENTLLRESIQFVSEREKTVSREAVKHLKEEILKDGLAVYGLDDTLKAVKNGQVELLIVEKDYKLKGCICEHCQIVKAGPIKDCPVCGQPVSEADVIEEIIEFAERTNAEIEFTDDEEISKLGHIGGILRYKS
jgi:peptide chain release factor subunit 1